MPKSFALSEVAIDLLTQMLGISVQVFPFQLAGFGALLEDRARLARPVADQLARDGLLDGGDLHEDVELGLRVLAESTTAVAAVGTVGDREIYGRVASTGQHAVLVLREGQLLRFDLIAPESLARAIVDLLPPLRPGSGHSVTINVPAPQPPASTAGTVRQGPPAAGQLEGQLRVAQEVLQRKRLGTGYLVVDTGATGRPPPAVNWIDTDAGRYMMISHPDSGGATLVPADQSRIVQQLERLLQVGGPA